MDRARFQHRPAGDPAAVDRLWLAYEKSEGSGVRAGHHDVAIAQEDDGIQRLAEAGGAGDDRVEHRLDVGRRAADDAQDLRRGGLLLQRLAQLVQQPGVLDGDDGLAGEVLDQLDLLVGECKYLLTIDRNRANEVALFDQRHHQERTGTARIHQGFERLRSV